MAFTLSSIAAKDSAGTAIAGGLLAADKAGGGAGPFIMAHLIADGVAGTNLAKVDSSNRVSMSLDNIAAALTLATITTLGTITNVVHIDDNSGSLTVDNGGIFAVQAAATLAAETTKVIGTVNLSAAQTLATVTNLATINGVAPAFGDGAKGATVLRATLATDSAGIITIGTAGTASSQVVTMQGIASMTPVVVGLAETGNFVSGAITSAMTGTTSTSLVGAPGASLRNYITTIVVSNSHATVGTDVIIQDGSGGTTLMIIPAAIAYGGGVVPLPTPLRQPTTNTALFCANVTTGASTKVSAFGYKGV